MLQTIHVCIDFCWYMLYLSVSLYILYLSLSVHLFLITVLVTNKRMYKACFSLQLCPDRTLGRGPF